jgi:hypothetical protein
MIKKALLLTIAAVLAFGAAGENKEEKRESLRLLKARVVLEDGTDIAKLQASAAKNATFVRAEALYEQTLLALKNKDRDGFNKANDQAVEAYLLAAKEGVVLAAIYAKQIAEERFIGQPERHDDITMKAGEALVKAKYCFGYLAKTLVYERTNDIENLGKTADAGLAFCDRKKFSQGKGGWIISRLETQSAHAKAVKAYLQSRKDAQ